MLSVIQRVSRASVHVDQQVVGQISLGVLVLVGVEQGDTISDVERTANKLVHLRIFPGRTPMDKSLLEKNAACLLVSQFTLLGRTDKGRRPSFDRAERPNLAQPLFDQLAETIRGFGIVVDTGMFGATMKVDLCNEGPVTLIYQSRITVNSD